MSLRAFAWALSSVPASEGFDWSSCERDSPDADAESRPSRGGFEPVASLVGVASPLETVPSAETVVDAEAEEEAAPEVDAEAGLDAEVEPESNADSPLGWNWNLFPPQFGQPLSISLEPSGNGRPQFVHWWGIICGRRAR